MINDTDIPTLNQRVDTPEQSPQQSTLLPTTPSLLADEEALRAVIAPIIQSKLRQWASELEDHIVADILSAEQDD